MTTGYLDPDGNSTPCQWDLGGGAASTYEAIDDGVRQPTAGTADNISISDGGENDQATVTMEIAGISNIDACTEIKIWIYGNSTAGEIPFVRIYTAQGWEANQAVDISSGYAWFSRTFTANQPYSQADIESLIIRFTADNAYGKYDGTWIRACYAEITYSETSGGYAHKFCGIAPANIGKISGVATANISKVKGV